MICMYMQYTSSTQDVVGSLKMKFPLQSMTADKQVILYVA